MKYFGLIEDDIYPKTIINRTRKSVRCILFNDNNQIALLYINCIDIFGERNHYETPGGGIEENEDLIVALKREIQEETGYSIKDIIEIGEIKYIWNLCNLETTSIFYTAIANEFTKTAYTEYEKELIKDIKWFTIDEVHKLYNKEVNNIGKLIHKRDYLMIKEAIKLRS